MASVLVWVILKVEPKTQVWMQVVYRESNRRKQSEEWREEDQKGRKVHKVVLLDWLTQRATGLSSPEDSEKLWRKCLNLLSPEDRKLGVSHWLPSPIGWGSPRGFCSRAVPRKSSFLWFRRSPAAEKERAHWSTRFHGLGTTHCAALNVGELRGVVPHSKRVGQTVHSVRCVGCHFSAAERREGEFGEVPKLSWAFWFCDPINGVGLSD